MVFDRNLAEAVGGKSARACDNCAKRRARWYCAADDAFLCQSCDSSVHSANPLARRHERVRLKTASANSDSKKDLQISVPTWHQGFTRKPRTPRRKKHRKLMNPLHMVPEMCSEEQSVEENEEQLLVPIFDPFEVSINIQNDFLQLDLAEFDVERFLEDEPFDMEGLGLSEKEEKECCLKMVKFEDEESAGGSYQIDIGRETFELNFDCDSTYEEEDENKGEMNKCGGDDCSKRLLKLDYEGVMSAWDGQKSPWTTGERPVFNLGDFWPPDCSGTSGAMHANGETGTVKAAMADGGREARVSRYREKRRTRLFSKKIRYEVRKLNAEKRPRMKGRFVKRANFAASAFPVLNK